MASRDFEGEKAEFRVYYDANAVMLQNASRSLASLLTDLLPQLGAVPVSKIESRLKDREECIKKFNLKYRPVLEENSKEYEIRDHISDLVGLRIVCLYEDDIEKIGEILKSEFEVVEVTDKISTIENTEASFGYKGLHVDLKLKNPRLELPEYRAYADLQFEVQVRTIVQDSWSVLDHKIKYKKSIPNHLKRRINTLAALFELADREFRQIRDSTEEEIQKEEDEPAETADTVVPPEANGQAPGEAPPAGASATQAGERRSAQLNAFNFLKIASHFFPAFDFEPQKVDGFVQEIVTAQPSISRAEFNQYLRGTIGIVKRYQVHFEGISEHRMNPYTVIRHSLYLGDKLLFQGILTSLAKKNFEAWLSAQAGDDV
ncbi:ppGpp synthetase catalytic domain-containing protein (RelA/SpoT-type nucleotidyltranferase) [Roseateles sp. YR242]|uniref:GTP pyrophosphokinase n=1 Tax=Roseateles sp. YR242 TaxID=1855305 RepID=UPI0008CC88C6|nr:(p)ppGpp synthetase [Roseateles sp. YR242]SEK28235.1 ppGpp synthetase catalytic domain-containing protein (RelA/SpoT-type nucleotidyltranferase) [Roseateles sp. YR242]